MKRSTRTDPGTQTRERSLRPRSTSIVCSARSFSDASSAAVSASPWGSVPAIGFSSAQRPIELDRRGRRRASRALRDHDLEDVALADVLLCSLDAAQMLLPRGLAHERPAGSRAARKRRLRTVECAGLATQQLGYAARVVEAEQDIRDEKAALGHAGTLLGQRHRRLEHRDGVVAEIADDRFTEGLRFREGDEPRAGADEAVPAEPPALDRLE